MRLFVLGGTGQTGLTLIDQALARGHQLTVFGRTPLPGITHPALTMRLGDPLATAELRAAIGDHDAVLSVLGTRGLGKTSLLADAAASTLDAMRATGSRRFIVVSSTLNDRTAGLAIRIIRRTLLRHHARDQLAMEAIVTRATDLDWTVVRVPKMTNGALTTKYDVSADEIAGSRRVSRHDAAHCLLTVAETKAHPGAIAWMGR